MTSYAQAIQTPFAEPDQLSNYRISGEQVTRLLHQLGEAGAILTAYFDAGRRFMFTSLLGQLLEQGVVLLDSGPDEAVCRRALNAGRLLCTARHEGVTVRFALEGLKAVKYQGKPAIAAPLPNIAYRFQRRAFQRITTPTIRPATCTLRLGDEGLTLPLADISCGGLSLIDRGERFAPALQQIYAGCRLVLPEFGELQVDLQIRNRRPHYLYTQEQTHRFGAQLLHLDAQQSQFLQRYITKLQMVTLPRE